MRFINDIWFRTVKIALLWVTRSRIGSVTELTPAQKSYYRVTFQNHNRVCAYICIDQRTIPKISLPINRVDQSSLILINVTDIDHIIYFFPDMYCLDCHYPVIAMYSRYTKRYNNTLYSVLCLYRSCLWHKWITNTWISCVMFDLYNRSTDDHKLQQWPITGQ